MRTERTERDGTANRIRINVDMYAREFEEEIRNESDELFTVLEQPQTREVQARVRPDHR